jgi:hypothetical protein
MYTDNMAINTMICVCTGDLLPSSPYRSSVSIQISHKSQLHIDHTHRCTLNFGFRKFSLSQKKYSPVAAFRPHPIRCISYVQENGVQSARRILSLLADSLC